MCPEGATVQLMLKSDAAKSVRDFCFVRCNGWCEICSAPVTKDSGQLHEDEWRGDGGLMSIDNSLFVCKSSHKYQHKGREPQFTRRVS